MVEAEQPEGTLGLADFLTDLRSELTDAQRRANGQEIRLEVDEVTLSMDLGVTVTNTGEGHAQAGAKFWVFASAEGGVRAARSAERIGSCQVKRDSGLLVDWLWDWLVDPHGGG